jgi:hypothetical protein
MIAPYALAALAVLAAAPPAHASAGLDASNERVTIPCVQGHPLVGHWRQPHCSGWATRAGRRVLMTYNSLGLRDKDYPARPAPGVLRVLATGGSVVAGSGLQVDDTPVRVIERTLRSEGLKAEVIDAAVDGYSGWENAVRLPEYLKAYSPQAVIYHFSSRNVVTDLSLWSDLRKDGGRVVAQDVRFYRWMPRPLRTALRRGPLGFLLYTYVEQWNRIFASWRIALIGGRAKKLDELLLPTLFEFRQMREECRSAGARFYILYGDEEVNADQYVLAMRPPLLVRFAQWFWVRQFRFDGAEVEKRLKAEGFEVLSVAEQEAALDSPSNRLPGDYHWNEGGARLFGEAAARRFAEGWRRAAAAPAASAGSRGGRREGR